MIAVPQTLVAGARRERVDGAEAHLAAAEIDRRGKIITLPGLCSFFPDQLLEIYLDIKEAGLITLGSKVTTIATVIVPVYAVVCLIFQPILYRVYQKVEIK